MAHFRSFGPPKGDQAPSIRDGHVFTFCFSSKPPHSVKKGFSDGGQRIFARTAHENTGIADTSGFRLRR